MAKRPVNNHEPEPAEIGDAIAKAVGPIVPEGTAVLVLFKLPNSDMLYRSSNIVGGPALLMAIEWVSKVIQANIPRGPKG